MNIRTFADALKLKEFNAGLNPAEVKGCYIGDLLSRVMTRAKRCDAWITVMPNVNVAAVAVLTEVSCVILAENVKPDPELLAKCENQGIALFGSEHSAYELSFKIRSLFTT